MMGRVYAIKPRLHAAWFVTTRLLEFSR